MLPVAAGVLACAEESVKAFAAELEVVLDVSVHIVGSVVVDFEDTLCVVAVVVGRQGLEVAADDTPAAAGAVRGGEAEAEMREELESGLEGLVARSPG